MYSEETPKWRLASEKPLFLHMALFVRDALLLEVLPEGVYPPRLRDSIPDLHDLLDVSMRTAATLHWGLWWEQTLEHSIRDALDYQGYENSNAVKGMVAAKDQFLNKVLLNTTTDASDASERLQFIISESSKWFYATGERPIRSNEFTPMVDANLISSIASDVLLTHGLREEMIAVAIFQLDVIGSWSQIFEDGVLIASNKFLANELLLRAGLRELFHLGTIRTSSLESMILDPPQDVYPVPSWSSRETPIDIAPVGGGKLILKEALHYHAHGFHLRIGLIGNALPDQIKDLVSQPKSDRPGPGLPGVPGVFDSLEIEIVFADGRTTGKIEAPRFVGRQSSLVSSRFWSTPVDPLELCLFVSPRSPLPSPEAVTIIVTWLKYGIANKSVSFIVVTT